jgi:gluconokinase
MTAPQPVVKVLKVVVMGVSGCGKSTVGRLLADGLSLPYVEGDELHPPENVARMAAGIALTDDDRQGWLHAVATRLNSSAGGAVVSCSALKRSYRDLLRAGAGELHFVHLQGSRAVLQARLAARVGHYMPPSLLQSQLDTLQPPTADEHALALDIDPSPEHLAQQALAWLKVSA